MSPFLAPLPGSTRLLVSVRDATEARAALVAGADLIDAKDPGAGALGALPTHAVLDIVAAVHGRALTSAVAGEPDSVPGLVAGIAAMAATGVSMVKVALTAGLAEAVAFHGPAAAELRRSPVVAVLFAEDGVSPEGIACLARAGFAGAMIDTRGKTGRRLPDLVPEAALRAFLGACAAHGLMSGLAGSLMPADIPALAALRPDYLGFRGGLCRGDRKGPLDPGRIAEAAHLLATVQGQPGSGPVPDLA